MATAPRRWIKSLIIVLLALTILFSAYVTLLAYPTPLFPNKIKYQNLTLYCDDKLDSTYIDILSDVQHRASRLDIYDSTHQYHIYLCKSQNLYSAFAKLVRKTPDSQGMVLTLLNTIFISQPRVDYMRSVSPNFTTHSFLDGDLAGVIAHEIGHQLIMKKTDYSGHSDLPFWKIEGISEFAGHGYALKNDMSYRLSDGIYLLYNDFFWGKGQSYRRSVYRAQILVDYLSQVEKLTVSAIIDYDRNDTDIENDLKAWYRLNKVYNR